MIQDVGLTISYQDGNTPIVGAKFDIFLVATVDEYGELTAAEAAENCPVSVIHLEEKSL